MLQAVIVAIYLVVDLELLVGGTLPNAWTMDKKGDQCVLLF